MGVKALYYSERDGLDMALKNPDKMLFSSKAEADARPPSLPSGNWFEPDVRLLRRFLGQHHGYKYEYQVHQSSTPRYRSRYRNRYQVQGQVPYRYRQG